MVVTSRKSSSIEHLRDQFPLNCIVLELDVCSTEDEIGQTIREASMALDGRIDAVVNNAGYGLIGPVEECSEDQIRRNMETNFYGPLKVIKASLPLLREQFQLDKRQRSNIVNISAAAAISNYAGFGVYGASKWALEGLSESLRQELQPFNIYVSLVQPGPFRTDFISRSMDRAESSIEDYKSNPSKRFGDFLSKMDGNQPGDPERAAQIICDLVGRTPESIPPLRLPLGSYILDKMKKKSTSLQKESNDFQEIARSADFVV